MLLVHTPTTPCILSGCDSGKEESAPFEKKSNPESSARNKPHHLCAPMPVARPALILLAEDEEADAVIFRMALQQSGLPHNLLALRDGQQIITYLRGDFPYSDRSQCPLPALLILDLDMPRMTGFDVLAWVAARPELKNLPAIVLSSSTREADIMKARQLGAADYHVKTHHIADLVQILQSLNARWLSPSPHADV